MERDRKRRKWDVPGPDGIVPPGVTIPPHLSQPSAEPFPGAMKPGQPIDIERGKLAAAAIASKFSMQGGFRGSALAGMDSKQETSREVSINDAPSHLRHHLTKKPTQDEIASKTRTVIVTRGRYYPPGAPVDENEKPLHLKITPGVTAGQTEEDRQQALNAAAAEIQRVLQGDRSSRAPYQQHHGAPPAMGGGPYAHPTAPYAHPTAPVAHQPSSTAVYVGFSAPVEFGLAGRLRGPGDQFLRHISGSGALQVVLRGHGSGMYESPEPLHFHISGPSQREVDTARSLAQDLINTVKKDFDQTHPQYAASATAAPPTYQSHYQSPYPTQTSTPGYAPPHAHAHAPAHTHAHAHTPAPYTNTPQYMGYPPQNPTTPQPATSAPPPQVHTSAPPAYATSAPSMYPPAAAYPPPGTMHQGPGGMPGYAPPAPTPAPYPYPTASRPVYPSMPGQPAYYPQGGQMPQYAPPPNPAAVAPHVLPPTSQAEPTPQPQPQPKRRFRESKDEHPQDGSQQVSTSGPYYEQAPYAQSYMNPPPASTPPATMPAPPLPTAGAMGPPPPRPPQGGSTKVDDAAVTGGPSLVDYEGED